MEMKFELMKYIHIFVGGMLFNMILNLVNVDGRVGEGTNRSFCVSEIG